MGTAIQSERAAPRRDPAGRTLTGRPDPTPLEALPKPDVTDPGDETSMPLIAPQPTPATRSNLGLRKLIGLPGWRWRKQGTSERAEADLEARRAAEELVAMRAQLEDAEAQRVQLEQDLAGRVDTVRREANTAHAARIAALETQAAD